MQKTHFDEFFDYMVNEIKQTRDEGQKEYAKASDVFDDFVQTAELTGTTPGMVLYTFLNKHIRGIGSFIRGHESQREHVSGRIKDSIVYLMLLWAMIEEDNMEYNEETTKVTNRYWTSTNTKEYKDGI
tara:strand:- start:1997 stop:2380 length:384 start_codon:yes stop_codon:yes gene_type:complete